MTRTEPRPDEDDEPGPRGRRRRPAAGHAGVVTRVLAACVDLGAVMLGAVLLDLAAAGVRFVWSPVTFRWPQPAVPVMGIAVVVVGVVYLTIAWAMTGRTYGERLLGLRVLSAPVRAARVGPVVPAGRRLRGLPGGPAVERGQRAAALAPGHRLPDRRRLRLPVVRAARGRPHERSSTGHARGRPRPVTG